MRVTEKVKKAKRAVFFFYLVLVTSGKIEKELWGNFRGGMKGL